MDYDKRIIRERRRELAELLGRRFGQFGTAGVSDICVAITTSIKAYPTKPNAYYAVQAIECDGEEDEGTDAELDPYNQPFFAYNIGGRIPPMGTYVILDLVSIGRWVFRY